MKKILMLLLFANTASAEIYDYPITRIIDGDTVEFQAAFLPPPLKPVLSIRVLGVDTPEKGVRAKCPEEALLGEASSKFTKNMVANSKKQQVSIVKWDKFGGRVLGDVLLDGKSLSEELINQGYARPYFGKKKESWCK
jgi:endonuclease YncB( thermonuclease family)